MPNSQVLLSRNRILQSLRPEAQAFIQQRWDTRILQTGDVLYRSGEVFTHAIFPHSGVISLMSDASEGRSVEKASIGNEGFLGFTYLLAGKDSLSETVVQVPGHASWVAMSDLDEAMELFVCVRRAMLAYAKALIVQLMESVSCNSLHSAEQRVSRWLLHADDRVGSGPFLLTQEALANVMGLRRATVSEACSDLLKAGAISYSRGHVEVLDRDVLRGFACTCYDRTVEASLPDVRF